MPKTILLADDSVTIRKVVELTFHDTEIRVEAVGSGSEALARLDAVRPDLVLADVVMPSPDGYEICRAVKGSGRPVPVLLLTGSFEPFDPERARECGADGHVRKPFESRALLDRVRELVNTPAAPVQAAPPPVPESVLIEDVLDDLASTPLIEEPLSAAGAASGDALDLLLGEPKPVLALPGLDAPAGDAETSIHVAGIRLGPEDLDALTRAVVARLSERVLREIAWEVVPDLAETIVRERIRQLERGDRDRSS